MKNRTLFVFFILLLVGFTVFTLQNKAVNTINISAEPLNKIPDTVKTILVKSCYDCHSDKSNNGFAKKVLNFDKWDVYKPGDQSKYEIKICDKINDDKMPPAGYLKKNPGLKLSDTSKTIVCNWAKPKK